MSAYMDTGFTSLDSPELLDAVIENDLFAIETTSKWENAPLPNRLDRSTMKPTGTTTELESYFESTVSDCSSSMINGGDRSRHRSFRPSKTINAKISRPSSGELACSTQVREPVNHD
jgi:hypothetical protein